MAYRSATRMYFDDPPEPSRGLLKRWNGSFWVKALLKVYLSGSWQNKPLKRWNGAEWLSVEASG